MTAVNLNQLLTELRAAGIPVPDGIGTEDDTLEGVHTYHLGFPVDLPPEAAAIVAAHVPAPPPLVYTLDIPIRARVRTSGPVATPTELFRTPLRATTLYDVVLRLSAVDRGNGAAKKLVVDMTVKRLNNGGVQVGSTAVLVNHADTQAATWTVGASFPGNDFVITVTGAANRTIDWSLMGTANSYTPDGA